MAASLIVAVALLAVGGAFLLVSSVVQELRRLRSEHRWARFEEAFREYAEQTTGRRHLHPHRRRPRNT